jgi:CubicO group peptidase (beta-lactamase class C family)
MRKICVLMVVGVIMIAGVAPAQTQKPSDTRAAKVDQLLKKWDRSDAPGCVVAVLKDGNRVYQYSGGAADVEFGVPLTLTTLFLVASVSKQFTAYAIMLLVFGGRLSLDDDVRKHLPELPDYGKTITVRHLIHHTSGVREYFPLLNFAGWRTDDVVTEKDLFDLVCRQKGLNFEPGAEYSYCNTGYFLLGMIVKRVSGQSLKEFTTKEIFKPLGMNNTVVRDDYRQVIRNASESYSPNGGGFNRVFLPHGLAGATNLFTTAEDLAIWDRNFYDPKIGGKSIIDAMHLKGKLTSGEEINYAAGLRIDKYRGLKTVEHTGAHGGFRTVITRFPEQHFTVIVLSNRSDFLTSNLARQIADIYLDNNFLEPIKKIVPNAMAKGKGIAKIQLTADEMKELSGDFYSAELDLVYHVSVKEGKLMLRHRKGEAVLTPTGVGKFSCTLAGMATVEYSRDANQRVSGFSIGVPSCRNLSFARVELPSGRQE